jgi:hypothetical protein
MRIRNLLPAALLVLAACTASTSPTATETESVGLQPGTKACCAKSEDCSAEKKAACEAAKACPEAKACEKAAGECPEGGKADG